MKLVNLKFDTSTFSEEWNTVKKKIKLWPLTQRSPISPVQSTNLPISNEIIIRLMITRVNVTAASMLTRQFEKDRVLIMKQKTSRKYFFQAFMIYFNLLKKSGWSINHIWREGRKKNTHSKLMCPCFPAENSFRPSGYTFASRPTTARSWT